MHRANPTTASWLAALLALHACTAPPAGTCSASIEVRLAEPNPTDEGDLADIAITQVGQDAFAATVDLFSRNITGGAFEIGDPSTDRPPQITPGEGFVVRVGIHSPGTDAVVKAIGRTRPFSCLVGEEPQLSLYVGPANGFAVTGTHAGRRLGATASALSDGRVLLFGGEDGNGQSATPVVVVYEHGTGLFCAADCGILGTPPTARVAHTATVLPDDTVVVLGGRQPDDPDSAIADAFVFNPNLERFDRYALTEARREHSAVYLPESGTVAASRRGKVLICGGRGAGPALTVYDSCLLFDPHSGASETVSGLQDARYQSAAAYIPAVGVLVAGGRGQSGELLGSAELFDAAGGGFSQVLRPCVGANAGLCAKRAGHSASLLDDGNVLLWGGEVEALDAAAPPQAEVFVVAPEEAFLPAGGAADSYPPRIGHVAVRIDCGGPPCPVLILGGKDPQTQSEVAPVLFSVGSNSAATYYDGVVTVATTAPTQAARVDLSAASLADGTVLVVGGAHVADGQALESAAIFSFCDAQEHACPTF